MSLVTNGLGAGATTGNLVLNGFGTSTQGVLAVMIVVAEKRPRFVEAESRPRIVQATER